MVFTLNTAADLLKSPEPLKYFLSFLVFLTLLTSCKDEEEAIFHRGEDYLALETGTFQIYTVNEVRYNVAEAPVETNYEILTQVIDSFPSTGGYTYVIHRSKRASEAEPWEELDTWSVRPANGDVIVSEGSTPFVKIKFPVVAENVWNGNIFNAGDEDIYQYADIARPLDLNGMFFENTLTVIQENNEDKIVFRDQRKETYALDVGLVYREFIQLTYCTDDACLGQQKVDQGVELKMVIKDYGLL